MGGDPAGGNFVGAGIGRPQTVIGFDSDVEVDADCA